MTDAGPNRPGDRDVADDVRLVPATPADLDVLDVYMLALRAEDPFSPGAADPPAARAAMARLLADPSLGRAWLIRSSGAAAGYVALTLGYSIEFGGRCAFIDELFVAPAFRGRGVGRRALTFAADAAAGIGVRVLMLEVSDRNERARRLYRACGFEDRTYRLMTKRAAP